MENHGYGHFKYMGKFIPQRKMRVGFVCGGTGITPLFSMMQASVLAKDGVKYHFLTSNKCKDDILYDNELK